MAVLTPEDHAFFKENGYVVVHNAVPQENLDAMVQALWEFLGMDPNDPEDWYRAPHRPGGMVEMYQHQALWNNRQCPRVHQAFAEIHGTQKLWVSIDRACMKPPRHPDHPDYDHKGFIHWDMDSTQLPVTFGVQGVLYLTNTAADQGGFQCVPELYRCFDSWVKTQPPDRNPRVPDLTGFQITPIPGKAGDLVIWDRLLAHGNGHNTSTKPRLAQYFSMSKARSASEITPEIEARRQERIRQWREHCPPKTKTFPGDSREIEETYGHTAELTDLGRKLLGLDPWPDDTP